MTDDAYRGLMYFNASFVTGIIEANPASPTAHNDNCAWDSIPGRGSVILCNKDLVPYPYSRYSLRGSEDVCSICLPSSCWMSIDWQGSTFHDRLRPDNSDVQCLRTSFPEIRTESKNARRMSFSVSVLLQSRVIGGPFLRLSWEGAETFEPPCAKAWDILD